MGEYSVKYKASSVLIMVLIALLIGGFLFVNFSFFAVKENKFTKITPFKVTDQDISAINEVKSWTIDNPLYKQLVPTDVEKNLNIAPGTKTNPFENKEQKE